MGALRNTCGGGLAIIMGSIEHKKNTSNWLSLILTLRLKLGHSEEERNQLETDRDDLIKLLRAEELKFYQRAKTTDVLFGYNNTRYFRMIANGKHRKKRIFSLEHEGGKIEGQKTLKITLLNSTKNFLDLRRRIISVS